MTHHTKRDFAAISLADHVLTGAATPPVAVIGPVVWDIPHGSDTRQWYFITASVQADNDLHICRIIDKDGSKAAKRIRADLMLELINRRPTIIHDFNDEAEMARFCEALCPSDRTRRIREGIERERADPKVQP